MVAGSVLKRLPARHPSCMSTLILVLIVAAKICLLYVEL